MKKINLEYLKTHAEMLVREYPVEMLTCIVAYVLSVLRIGTINFVDNALLMPLVFGAVYAVNNWAKQGKLPRAVYYATALLIVVAVVVSPSNFIDTPAYGFGLLLAAMFLLLSDKGMDDNSVSGNFFKLIYSAAMALIVCVVLLALTSLIYVSVVYIFSLKWGDGVLEYILEFIGLVITPATFLVSVNTLKDRDFVLTKFADFLVNYILGSAIIIYVAILYIYLVKIAVTVTLPLGGLAAMITAFYIIAFLWLMLHKKIQNKYYHWAYKYFGYATLPLLVLFWIGLAFRIREYGFTESRVYMVVAGIEMAISSLVLIFAKRNRFSAILYTAAALIAVSTYIPYISAKEIGMRSQTERLINLAHRAKAYDEKTGHLLYLNKIDKKYVGDYKEMVEAYRYLSRATSNDEMVKRYGTINKTLCESDYYYESSTCYGPSSVNVGEYRYYVGEETSISVSKSRVTVTLRNKMVIDEPFKISKEQNGALKPSPTDLVYRNNDYMLIIQKMNFYNNLSNTDYWVSDYAVMSKKPLPKE